MLIKKSILFLNYIPKFNIKTQITLFKRMEKNLRRKELKKINK